MSSAQVAAHKGKERIDAALSNGDLRVHPYKLSHFSSKIVKGVAKSPVVPGNVVEEMLRDECAGFFGWMRNQECTSKQNNGYKTKCDCRTDIRDGDVVHAKIAMANFFTMSRRGKDVRIQDHINQGILRKRRPRYLNLGNKRVKKENDQMRGKLFTLFYSRRDIRSVSQVYEIKCCLHTLLMFYNIPYKRFKGIEKNMKEEREITSAHGLTGKKSNFQTPEYKLESMRMFFSALEKEAEPHATKVVRTKTGIALRDNDDSVDLPSCYSKRSLYCKLMHLWGWVCRADGRGNFGKLQDYEARSFDEFWVAGECEIISPISYSTSFSFWAINYPKLKIRSPSYDTCSLCFKFSCNLSSILRAANECNIVLKDVVYQNFGDDEIGINEGEEVDDELINVSKEFEDDSSCSSTEENNNKTDGVEEFEIQQSEPESDDPTSDSEDVNELNIQHETLVLEMGKHCNMWKTQREYVQKKRDEGKNDFLWKVLWPLRRDIFVCDYMQNLDLPHYGGEQPGDTYYYSPLAIFGFGVVDYSIEQLYAYIYTEGEGKKGGNNVVSLIHDTLKKKGVFEDAERLGPGKSLTLVFDNCGGQNKNRMVLRYALYLVEKGIYKSVELVFWYAGTLKMCATAYLKN